LHRMTVKHPTNRKKSFLQPSALLLPQLELREDPWLAAADNERLQAELQRLSAASRRSNHNMQQITWIAQAIGEMWSEEKTELARRRAHEGLFRDLHDSECRDLCRMRNWTWLS